MSAGAASGAIDTAISTIFNHELACTSPYANHIVKNSQIGGGGGGGGVVY